MTSKFIQNLIAAEVLQAERKYLTVYSKRIHKTREDMRKVMAKEKQILEEEV